MVEDSYRVREKPKSAIFTSMRSALLPLEGRREVNSRFSGLRSRCTTPRLWQ